MLATVRLHGGLGDENGTCTYEQVSRCGATGGCCTAHTVRPLAQRDMIDIPGRTGPEPTYRSDGGMYKLSKGVKSARGCRHQRERDWDTALEGIWMLAGRHANGGRRRTSMTWRRTRCNIGKTWGAGDTARFDEFERRTTQIPLLGEHTKRR